MRVWLQRPQLSVEHICRDHGTLSVPVSQLFHISWARTALVTIIIDFAAAPGVFASPRLRDKCLLLSDSEGLSSEEISQFREDARHILLSVDD